MLREKKAAKDAPSHTNSEKGRDQYTLEILCDPPKFHRSGHAFLAQFWSTSTTAQIDLEFWILARPCYPYVVTCDSLYSELASSYTESFESLQMEGYGE